jgi:hypothetical protein
LIKDVLKALRQQYLSGCLRTTLSTVEQNLNRRGLGGTFHKQKGGNKKHGQIGIIQSRMGQGMVDGQCRVPLTEVTGNYFQNEVEQRKAKLWEGETGSRAEWGEGWKTMNFLRKTWV